MLRPFAVTLSVLMVLLSIAPASNAQEPDQAVLTSLLTGYRSVDREFQFGLVGDQQYTPDQEARFPEVIRAMDREPLAFVAHDGDMKGGGACSDEFFRKRYDLFQTSRHPFIYTPGDNDWTDCHTPGNGSYDPLERLAAMRRVFFARPSETLGQAKLSVTTQAEQPAYGMYPENLIWAVGNVVFVTIHMVGSNDGLGRTAEGDRESRDRSAACQVWLRTAFQLAREGNFRGVTIITQANPQFDLTVSDSSRVAFGGFLETLEREVRSFGGPVLFVHGDSHYFRIDKPLPLPLTSARLTNFTRLETFGPPDLHWVRVRVVPASPGLFLIEPQILTP